MKKIILSIYLILNGFLLFADETGYVVILRINDTASFNQAVHDGKGTSYIINSPDVGVGIVSESFQTFKMLQYVPDYVWVPDGSLAAGGFYEWDILSAAILTYYFPTYGSIPEYFRIKSSNSQDTSTPQVPAPPPQQVPSQNNRNEQTELVITWVSTNDVASGSVVVFVDNKAIHYIAMPKGKKRISNNIFIPNGRHTIFVKFSGGPATSAPNYTSNSIVVDANSASIKFTVTSRIQYGSKIDEFLGNNGVYRIELTQSR
jgi:hypothetical protein